MIIKKIRKNKIQVRNMMMILITMAMTLKIYLHQVN